MGPFYYTDLDHIASDENFDQWVCQKASETASDIDTMQFLIDSYKKYKER